MGGKEDREEPKQAGVPQKGGKSKKGGAAGKRKPPGGGEFREGPRRSRKYSALRRERRAHAAGPLGTEGQKSSSKIQAEGAEGSCNRATGRNREA